MISSHNHLRGYIGTWIVDYVLAFVKNWAGISTNQVCGMRVYEILNMLRSSKLTHVNKSKVLTYFNAKLKRVWRFIVVLIYFVNVPYFSSFNLAHSSGTE